MVSLNSRMMMFLRGHHFVSFFKIRWLVLCHHFVFWLFRLGLPSLISTPTFVFFVPSFSTDLLLLYQAVFVLSAIVCTISDNWFKFLFAAFVELFNVRDSWCMEQIMFDSSWKSLGWFPLINLPPLHKVGWMSFLPISLHVLPGLAEVWLDDLNII